MRPHKLLYHLIKSPVSCSLMLRRMQAAVAQSSAALSLHSNTGMQLVPGL